MEEKKCEKFDNDKSRKPPEIFYTFLFYRFEGKPLIQRFLSTNKKLKGEH